MAYRVRSWTVDDEGDDREISRAVYPEYRGDPAHPAWFPAQQLGAPREYVSRYIAEESAKNSAVGYTTLWELRPSRYRFDLAVRPEWQRHGIATALFAQITSDAWSLGATGLQARVRDDRPWALTALARRGFIESHRMGAYRLDFAGKDLTEFHSAFAQLRRFGIEVTTLAAVREQDSNFLERFYDLYSAARNGWPDPDPDPHGPTRSRIEEVERLLHGMQLPEAFFIARDGERYVAFTSFFGIGTAVHPEYRRRGIATLIKAGSIADAQQRAFNGQTTSTANPAMQAVLGKLGYRRLWSEVRLIRELSQAESSRR